MGLSDDPRLRAFAASIALLVALSLFALGHGVWRRSEDASVAEAKVQLVGALGFADLALSSGARWLRHPSQSEHTAAATDLPAALDVDPAGAMLGPPMEPRP